MKQFPYSVSFHRVRRYLLAGVLAGLCFSFTANLRQQAAPRVDSDVEPSPPAISLGVTVLTEEALTSSVDAHTEKPASRQYRLKRLLAHLAALPPEKFGVPVAAAHHLKPSGGPTLSYSSFYISRQRGRAPPRMA